MGIKLGLQNMLGWLCTWFELLKTVVVFEICSARIRRGKGKGKGNDDTYICFPERS